MYLTFIVYTGKMRIKNQSIDKEMFIVLKWKKHLKDTIYYNLIVVILSISVSLNNINFCPGLPPNLPPVA